MENVKVSRKYQVVIPEKLRHEAGIRPGDMMVAIVKNGILQYVPVRPLRTTRGMIKGMEIKAPARRARPLLISIDSYGWIERFTEGPKSSQYDRVIDSMKPKEIITSGVAVYEVYKKVKGLRGEQTALEAVAVLSQTSIIVVDQTLCLEAADYSLQHDLHFADALVYATARHYGAQLYTGDEDLRRLKGVSFI